MNGKLRDFNIQPLRNRIFYNNFSLIKFPFYQKLHLINKIIDVKVKK